jgi:hypothetical protein
MLLCCVLLLFMCNQKATEDSKAHFIEICGDTCNTYFFIENQQKVQKKSYINAKDSALIKRMATNADTITLDIEDDKH